MLNMDVPTVRAGLARPAPLALACLVGLALAVVASSPLMGQESGLIGRIFRKPESTPTRKKVEPASGRSRRAETEADIAPPVADESAPIPSLPPGARVGAPANGDPLVSRFCIGRAADGQTFGMFLHVFADGTVMDSAGLHHSDPAQLDRLRDVLKDTPVDSLEGHCDGTAGDYLEVVYVILYQRAGGKIRARTLSYAGNTQGCDPALQKLQATLEGFQAHLSSPTMPGLGTALPDFGPAPAPTVGSPTTPEVNPASTNPAPPPPIVPGG